ncbi:hypothetical protein [Streptomyces sp. NPDC054771]
MEDRTFYYRHEGGSYSTRTVNYPGDIAPPEGAVGITESDYTEGVAAVEAANAKLEEEQRGAEMEQCRADYEALIVAGVPQVTASRLTGYTLPSPAAARTRTASTKKGS